MGKNKKLVAIAAICAGVLAVVAFELMRNQAPAPMVQRDADAPKPGLAAESAPRLSEQRFVLPTSEGTGSYTPAATGEPAKISNDSENKTVARP